MRNVFTLLTAGLVVAACTASVLAQTAYPAHTVRLIVPTSPGATTDVLARGIGQALSQAWGQPVVVENRPGADEMLGDELVAKADPDGYTLGVVSNAGITAAPFLHREVHYDPLKDFTPIFNLGEITPVMVVPVGLPIHSVQDLIAQAKQHPGALNYGSFGVGGYAHVAMEDFKRRTGVQMTHIPYRGATPAYQALIRGEVAVLIANLSGAEAQEKGGTVRIIAAASLHRIKERPDLPTVAESGVPGFSTTAWWGVFGPARLPADVVDKIRGEIAKSLDGPEMRKIYQANTMQRDDMNPEQFAAFVKSDTENWERQIKAAGIKPE